jgi:hypothetical protein
MLKRILALMQNSPSKVRRTIMNIARRIVAICVLTVVCGVAAFADDPPSCNPGETHGPPCSAALITTDDSTNPGETNSPPAADPIDIKTLVEVTLTALLIL